VKVRRDPPGIHAPMAAYSHQIEVTGGERLLFMSGQVGVTPDGRAPEDGLDQLAVALDNVLRNLEAAGMGASDVVKVTFYMVGEMDTKARRELIARKLGGERPCMTVVHVAALASPTYKVEVDAWAASSAAG
jgi:2-iminobutanoate/2-iminopropanoate deaminase